jgi:hypothetical protein
MVGFWSLAGASDQAGLARSSPATWAGLGPARKNNNKNKIKFSSKLFQKKNLFFKKKSVIF